MKNRIKFHSIFYRYILFIFLLSMMTIYVISVGKAWEIDVFGMMIVREQLKYIVIVIVILTVILSFFNWKFYICKEGIYLRKIDLFVGWNDITAVSHVWINEWNMFSAGNVLCYNRKTLVIYREKYKPICIYNISLLALYAVKLYNFGIKTNIVSSTLATTFNLLLNAFIFYEIYFTHLNNIRIDISIIWAIMYAIKVFAVPLIMVKQQNKMHGVYLLHDKLNKHNASDAIHI